MLTAVEQACAVTAEQQQLLAVRDGLAADLAACADRLQAVVATVNFHVHLSEHGQAQLLGELQQLEGFEEGLQALHEVLQGAGMTGAGCGHGLVLRQSTCRPEWAFQQPTMRLLPAPHTVAPMLLP